MGREPFAVLQLSRTSLSALYLKSGRVWGLSSVFGLFQILQFLIHPVEYWTSMMEIIYEDNT